MSDGFGCFAFFIEGSSQHGVTICIVRPDQQSSAAMRDCSVEFAFLDKRSAETIAREKVIGPYCYCFLVMNDRMVEYVYSNLRHDDKRCPMCTVICTTGRISGEVCVVCSTTQMQQVTIVAKHAGAMD